MQACDSACAKKTLQLYATLCLVGKKSDAELGRPLGADCAARRCSSAAYCAFMSRIASSSTCTRELWGTGGDTL